MRCTRQTNESEEPSVTSNSGVAAIACELCAGTSVSVIGERSRSGAPLRTVACHGCGLVWSDPRPHDVRTFYESAYRVEYKGTFEPRPKHVLRAGQVALARLESIRPWLKGRMRVLDVGSGGGEFAYLLKTLGHDVQGVEPNRGYAGYAAGQYGLDVSIGFIDDVDLPEARYDLITLWHVLEHTEHPGAVLRRLRRALVPGGTLVVEVPNVEATCQSPSSTFHEAHLYNFNAPTLTGLARKVGLTACASRLSTDGGNLCVVFRPSPEGEASADADWRIPGNCQRVERIVAAHQGAAHWISAHPYRRLGGRLARSAAEWLATRVELTGKARLDRLYAKALGRAGEGRSRGTWGYIATAYVGAVLLEWALLDASLLGRGVSDLQALGAYLAAQTAAVGAIVWATRRPRTPGQYARLAAWSLPLFALPAYC